jgi:hypothetical protein
MARRQENRDHNAGRLLSFRHADFSTSEQDRSTVSRNRRSGRPPSRFSLGPGIDSSVHQNDKPLDRRAAEKPSSSLVACGAESSFGLVTVQARERLQHGLRSDWQITDACAGGSENGISDRRRNRRCSWLAQSDRRWESTRGLPMGHVT